MTAAPRCDQGLGSPSALGRDRDGPAHDSAGAIPSVDPLDLRDQIATVTATIIDSAPILKIRRPAAITGNDGDIAVTSAPTLQRGEPRPEPIYDDGADEHDDDVRQAVETH